MYDICRLMIEMWEVFAYISGFDGSGANPENPFVLVTFRPVFDRLL